MSDPARNRFAGLVRFSYPAVGGFAHQHPDPPSFLYAEDRLERRFRLFEALCLPSLLAQRDRDFTTIFLIGEDFPVQARNRLAEAIASLPGSRILALPPLQHYVAMRHAFGTVDTEDATHLTTFRLDDDDALSQHYISNLRRLSAGLIGLRPGTGPVSISFHRGLLLLPDGDVAEVVEKLPPASGSALITPAGHRDNIYRRNHRLLPQFFTHFSEAETLSFIRSVHQDNDSNPHSSGLSTPLSRGDAETALHSGFPFTLDSLRSL